MNAFRLAAFVLGLGVVLGGEPAMAQVLDPAALARKQADQQRAKAMTRELLNGVLDLQLRQLEENDLSDLEIYHEILLMRGHLNEIIDAEMTKVVDLLADAQQMPQDKRETAFVDARKMIRTIVLTLSAERQNLLRRLKVAELAEQVRRLISLETRVQTATRRLPEEAKEKQQPLTVKAVEDQRDVKELFLLLVDTMTDVRTWGGALSHAAADGLKLLKVADVGKHLDEAGQSLSATQFTVAVEHQESALKGLRELLKLLQRTHGVMATENQTAISKLKELTRQQEAVREETRKLDAAQPAPEKLVEQQTQIQKELAKLETAVAQQPAAEAHLEEAEKAANEAAAKLFENNPEAAALEQSKVLGHLAALEATLNAANPAAPTEQSAAELAKRVEELQAVQQQLAQADQKQAEAEKQAAANSQAAAKPEAESAALINQALKTENLPETLANRLEDAKEAAVEAAQELSQAGTKPAENNQSDAMENAEDALDRAQAAVAAALAETQLKQAAVEIGELARAAEVLERAAAEERQLSDAAENAAEQKDAAAVAEAAREVAADQQMVASVAEKVAEGLKETSPEAAQMVAAGAKAAAEAKESAAQAAEQADNSMKDAQAAAEKSSDQAEAAAEKFAAAAKELRQEIVEAAAKLADSSKAQAEKLAAARSDLEKALEQPATTPADRWKQLQDAQAKVAEAAQQQLIAAGKPDAAKAMKLAEQIEAAAKAQDAAGEMADLAMESDAISPLQAAIEQQTAVEEAEQAAAEAAERPMGDEPKPAAADQLAKALKEAQAAAAAAAKNLVDGNEQAAKAAQQTAKSELQKALELAKAEMKVALEKPAEEKPDAKAQEKANQSTEAAQKLAADDAPEADAALGEAVAAGEDAKEAIAEEKPADIEPAQKAALAALEKASEKLAAAMADATKDQRQQLADKAKEAVKLEEKAAELDLGTAEALEAAQDAAEQGSKDDISDRQRNQAAEKAQRNLERAAANLMTKEQSVRRDQEVADALAELAEEQEQAAAAIDEQRDDVMEPSAAEALADATRKFAEAQEAIGEGAVELSGQSEVANLPLREALELASKFSSQEMLEADLHAMPKDAAHGEMPDKPEPVAETNPETTNEDEPAAEAKDEKGEPVAEGEFPDDMPADLLGEDAAAAEPLDLGTKVVPKSPEATAKMMAGRKAQEALRAAQAKHAAEQKSKRRGKPDPRSSALARKLGQTEDSEFTEPLDETPEETTAATESAVKSRRRNAEAENQDIDDRPLKRPDDRSKVTDSRGEQDDANDDASSLRKFQEAAWFAKLPPELRKSIRANARQRGPRAYEEKLRKYFESVD